MRRLYLYPVASGRYVLVRGHVREWLVAQRIPALWSPTRSGWYVREERAGDLIAQAEVDGFSVRMKGAVR